MWCIKKIIKKTNKQLENNINYAKEINNYFKQHEIDYYDENNIIDKQIIYDLLFNNIIPKEQNSYIYNLLGIYYNINNDYQNMLKYYLLAIEKEHYGAVFNIALYYEDQKDYANMMKYYLLAVDNKDTDAMFNLGNYFYKIQDYFNMEKYYLMAIKYGDSCAMNNLAIYYEIKKDYPTMLKYYVMAINKGHRGALFNLNCYYEQIEHINLEKYDIINIKC